MVGRVNVNLWLTFPPGVDPPVLPSVLVIRVSDLFVICAALAVTALYKLMAIETTTNAIREYPLTLTFLMYMSVA